MDTIENTDTHMNPPEWEGPSEWDEGNIVETARIINFDSTPSHRPHNKNRATLLT